MTAASWIWNPAAETQDRDARAAEQGTRLRELAVFCYSNSFVYQRQFDEYDIDPQAIRSVEDIEQLPFTVKGDLRDTYPLGLLAVDKSEIARIQASSGTRGKLGLVAYTQADLEIWAEVCARSLALAGTRPGEGVQNSYEYGLFTGGLGIHAGAERLGATVIPMSGGNTVRQVQMLRDLGATTLACTPSYALIISEIMEREGIYPADLGLRYGIFGAEPWTEEMRLEIERRLDITAVDIYGLSEVIGPGVACECVDERDGLHVQEDHFLVEVIDPNTGEQVEDGHFGELVFTTLTKQAMPLIRFRTGDISAIIDAPCSCGRSTRRIARIRGRIDDMIVLHGVNVYPSEIEATLLSFDEIAPFYEILLDWDGRHETINIRVETTPQYAADTLPADRDRLAGQLARILKSRFDLTMQVDLLDPGELRRDDQRPVDRVVDRRT